MIKITGVSKRFNSKIVLENVHWEVPKGSIYGLVGPNGAGKSTLLRIMAGVLPSETGSITIDQQAVYDNPLIKRHILFVSDDPFFLPQSNLKEMREFYEIFYPHFNEGMYNKLLGLFRLSEFDRIQEFSKGMKRQAGLILALSVNPDVLLLDEAFDGLDPVMRLTLKRILADELMNREMTVVISSHNLRELEDICDRIAMLNDHSITIQDEIEALRSHYHKLQIGYTEATQDDYFKSLNPLHLEKRGHVYMMVLKGDVEKLLIDIKATHPVLFEEIPITMEEVFVYEMEGKGYGQLI